MKSFWGIRTILADGGNVISFSEFLTPKRPFSFVFMMFNIFSTSESLWLVGGCLAWTSNQAAVFHQVSVGLVSLGFALEALASKLCFRYRFQVKLQFGGTWMQLQCVEIIPTMSCGVVRFC